MWKSPDDHWLLEGSGFFKPYGSWLLLPSSLVQGTDALARAQGVPAGALPQNVGLNTDTLRVSTKLSWEGHIELIAAYQATAVLATAAAFTASGSSTYLGASLVTPQRRLVDLPTYLVSDNGYKVQQNLDRLAFKYSNDHFSLVIGRQVLSWGTGKLWNPTDLVSPFAPTDIDREVRRGADAVRASISLGATSQLELLWLPQQALGDQGGVIRGRTNVLGWDFSATVAKYATDLVFGADFDGDLGPLGFHGEGAWTVPLDGLDGDGPLGAELGFVRAVGGFDWRPTEKLVLTAEYYFNGFGARSKDQILAKLRSAREVRGEVFGAGRHYAGLIASFLASDVLTINTTVLVNCTDPSAMIIPAIEYTIGQHVLIRAGGFIPLGEGLDVPMLQALTPTDAATNSPAWQTANATLGARSEYGLSPFGVFVQVGLYIN